jgi:hypothetical protein
LLGYHGRGVAASPPPPRALDNGGRRLRPKWEGAPAVDHGPQGLGFQAARRAGAPARTRRGTHGCFEAPGSAPGRPPFKPFRGLRAELWIELEARVQCLFGGVVRPGGGQ